MPTPETAGRTKNKYLPCQIRRDVFLSLMWKGLQMSVWPVEVGIHVKKEFSCKGGQIGVCGEKKDGVRDNDKTRKTEVRKKKINETDVYREG